MTTTSQSPPLKTDVLGRVRITAKHRKALLDAFEQSSLSGIKFAAAHGIKYPTFANWVQKRRRERGQYVLSTKPVSTSLIDSLVELEMPVTRSKKSDPPIDHTDLCMEHSSGFRIHVRNPEQARLAAILIGQLNLAVSC
jgi:hypothetical protein